MTEKQLDLRGLICADRAERIRAAFAEPGLDALRVVVDDQAKAEHAQSTAAACGWTAQIQPQGGGFHVLLRPGTNALDAAPAATATAAPAAAAATEPPFGGCPLQVVAYLNSSELGMGDEQLGRILMRAFIKTLKELDPLPERVFFVNSGVRLTTRGSALLGDLRELEQRGVRLLSCGTCLDYYHLQDALEIGTVTNMYDIAAALVAADRVLKP